MRVLIIGGTGMIGAHAAVYLRSQGVDVTLGARKPPAAETPIGAFKTLIGDYVAGGFSPAELRPFDAIVFAAGNDIRHLPKGADEQAFWDKTQIDGVPTFIARAREAGVPRVVHIGSYYHQAMPALVARNPYVRARALADERARALSAAGFNVSTLNPPSIVGAVPGLPAGRYRTLAAYGRGEIKEAPIFAPRGGTNFMSVQSLSEAIWGALRHAEAGKAYLVGDQNLTFREYFQMIFDAVGNPHQLEERDAPHPMLPDAFIIPGRGTILAYEPDPVETAMLGYRRGDVRRAVNEAIEIAGRS